MLTQISMLSSVLKARSPRKQEGASAVEYGLILGLIAVVVIVALGLIGTDLLGLFNQVVTALPGGG